MKLYVGGITMRILVLINTNDIYCTFSCNTLEQPSCTLSLSFFSFVLPSLSFSTRYHDFESMYGMVEVDM